MLRRTTLCALSALILALPVLVVADEGAGAPAAALRAAHEPLRDRDWARAADLLAKVRKDHPGTPQAQEAWVLEARALHLAGKHREAVDAGTAFLQAFGDAVWAGRMKATLADAYAALRADADASRVLKERAEFLTGDDHRAKIAALYTTLADEDFDGKEVKDDLGRPQKKKDFPAALAAYNRALEVGVAAADLLRVRARGAQCFEEVGDWANAAAAWDRLLKEHEKTAGADPEAWLVGRGRARLRAGASDDARKDLREAAEKYPAGKRRLETLRLLAEERFARAGSAPSQEERDLAFEEGVQFLRRAIAEHRDDKDAPAVQRSLAEAYAGRAAWQKAAAEWRGLVERFPSDPAAPEWRNALAEALASAGRWDEAVAEWKAFLSAFPNHPLWRQAQDRIPQARFAKGQMLAEQGEKDAAITAWRAFAEEYATEDLAPEALVRVGALLRERKDFEGAIATWRGVTGRYQQSPQAPGAWLAVATTLEDDLRRLDDAVKEYEELLKKFPVPQARERLARLKGKHLEVRGERVVGSADPAVLKVVTRNLPTLKVRVYRLGLEEYFRRKQTVSGVESLQVEIVKPDATAEWKVEPYAPFALVEAERPVPVQGPGAYVVVAGDDDLTSTTLLLVSDVETVVKGAPGRQVFAWVRHRATGEPVEGARVLVSDGSKVFAEGTTGKDGVWVLETDKTAKRVLVLSGAHAASSEWEPGPTFAEGWQSKAHVATDRPVYRPGQPVKWRAVYRRADGGGYRIPAGAKAVAVLVNARGAEVERRDVVASDMGVFDGEFALDGAAPLGDWAVRLLVDNAQFGGAFQVLEYRKPEFTLAVVPDKPTYRTGEEVKATIRLAYTFGGPVVGAPVEWEVVRVPRDFSPSSVDDYSWYFQDAEALERARRAAREAPKGTVVARGSARTDDRGEAAVSFATAERDEDAEYAVRASATDVTRRFVQDEGRVPVVRRDHWAVVTADKRVYRPKQELRATIRTVDANQTPVARSGEVVLLRVRRTPVPPPVKPPLPTPPVRRGVEFDGKRPPVPLAEEEIEVQKVPVTTDASGRAEVRLVVPGPGVFRVRWNATDARGALVTAYAQVDVSGEAEDLTRDARLVAAKEAYTEGDRAEVLLQSPVTRVKALLTFEGEKVLAHRLVEVETTSQILDVPVEGLYAPNVTMKVAIPGKDRLLEAEDDIVVFRYLKVEVTPSKASAAPGDKIGVEVATTDAAGKPVAAEVGLAFVDDALFSVAPDKSAPIRPFFYDRKRVNRVVTSSSVGFRTYGTTRETNKDLLANAEALTGDPGKVVAREALRVARAALQRGEVETAVAQALRAAASDPESWDARNFLNQLSGRADAQDALARLDNARMAEMRKAMEEAKESASKRDAPARLRRPAKGDALPPPPAAAPAPMPPGSPAAEYARSADAKDKDARMESEDAEAQDGYLAEEKAIGVGGGAGGSFKGRGGHRNLRAGGGGRKAEEPAQGSVAFTAPGAEEWGIAQQAQQELGFVASLGDEAQLGELFKNLRLKQQSFGLAAEAVLPEPSLRKTFLDTALWMPRLATDASGRGRAEVTLPDNLTRWRATARGVAGESLFGEGRAFVTARREVLVRVDAPRFLVQGDEATVPTVVHNESGGEITAEVRVSASGAELAGRDGTVVVPAGGRSVVDRPLSAKDAGPVRIEASVTSAAGGDKVEAALRTAPRGLRVTDGRSGVVSAARGEEQGESITVPAGAVPGSLSLSVVLYPGVDAAVMDALAFLDVFPYACVEQTVHRVLPDAWARRALSAIGSPDAKRLEALDRDLKLTVGRLRNLSNDDGTFGWWRGGRPDVAMTALALLGLVEGARAEVPGARDAMLRTGAALRGVVRSAPDDAQALAHWALAEAGLLDEEAYQVTFRRRNEELSVPGLAWMGFASRALGREFEGDEVVRLLLARKVEDGAGTKWPAKAGDCLVGSERLSTALAVRALVELGEASDAAERGMRWLLADRPRGGPGTTMESAAFIGACAAWIERARPAAFGGTIEVLLDGKAVRTVRVQPGGGLAPEDRRFTLDVASWAEGAHRVAFRLSGQGELGWAARLDATVASAELPADEHGLRVERLYLDPDLPPVEGAEMPVKPGHEILRLSARPKVEAKSRDRAAPGERVLVRVSVTAPRDLRYITLEDPLPAGFEVLEGTASGPFDWQERRDDRQVFFLSEVKAGTVVLTYAIQAVHLGAFTALPARAHAMYLPEVNGRSGGHRWTVAEGGGGPGTEGAPTPDEVYAAARKLLEKKEWAEAAKAMAALKALPLRDEVAEEIEAALLRCAIETKDAKEIVRAREDLVRRNASRIPSDLPSARAIAAAYHEVGAYGVSSTLFRDLVARAFGLETGWAEHLKARAREPDGLAALGEALKAYPVGNATAAAALARAARFRDLRRPEGGALKAGAPMDEEGLAALRDAAAHYAETPLAAPASYAIVEALRRTRDLDGAVAEATAFPRRFPDSPFVDDALFFLMDSRLAKFEAAPSTESAAPVLEAAKRLTDEQFRRPDNRRDFSEFRPRAFHGIARVRHVLGDLTGAIEAYREAAGTIEDAREALAYLTETRLELPESTTAAVEGKASFAMRYRNVGEVRFLAYPVDLQVLFAVRRTLEGLNRIDLSGISPAKEWAVAPKDGGDHAWHETQADLPVGEGAAGVYLVVAKAGALEASTVVIKTDLRVVLQTIGEKVRVHVTDAAGRGVRGAFVTVSDGQAIKSRGLTDGRGVFEAPGVGAKPFVVVNAGERFGIAR